MSRLLLLLLLVGCGEAAVLPPDPPPPPPPPAPPKPLPQPVVRPTAVEPAALLRASWPLPADMGAVSVGLFDGRTLIGGNAGLFELSGSILIPVDDTPVFDLAGIPGVGLLVAAEDGIYLWDGDLLLSELDAALSPERIQRFAERDGELWFTTDAALYRFVEPQLERLDFGAMTDVKTFDGSDTLSVRTASAGWGLLRTGGTFELQTFTDEKALEDLAGGAAARLFGISDGALFERVPVRTAFAWRPVSLVLDGEDPGATEIERLVVDPAVGSVWALGEATFARIDGTRVATVTKTSTMASLLSARITRDGALWVSDGVSLERIGNAEPPPSYAERIAPFYDDNCERCHAPLGIGRLVLDSYESWRDNAESIVQQIEAETMPADAMPVVGDPDIVRRWLEGGLRP